MAADGNDKLDEAAKRRSRGAKPPRNPRPKETPEDRAARLQREQEQREEARRKREEAEQREEEERRRAEEDEERKAAEARRQAEDEERKAAGASVGKKRPTSIPFYPNPEDEELLWLIQEAATAARVKVPATAVLRYALRRLRDQKSPAEVVQALSGPVQTKGKMGRPRR